jgi:glycosyltransferase involved in cell wall biosynthesis
LWGNGEESVRSLKAYGVPRSRIDLGMGGMDTMRWRREVEDGRGAARSALRKQFRLEGTVILFVGDLIALKGIKELLSALSILAADHDLPPWSVLFVGWGPLAQEIHIWTESHLTVPVALAGFVQPRELAKYYAAADLFAMPSLFDQWGFVCLEALVAGIPQVTSLFAGAAALITSREIGSVVDPRDSRSLANHLGDQIRMGPQRVPEVLCDRAMTQWSVVSMVDRAISSVRLAAQDRSKNR